jgi:hypothetical protein
VEDGSPKSEDGRLGNEVTNRNEVELGEAKSRHPDELGTVWTEVGRTKWVAEV